MKCIPVFLLVSAISAFAWAGTVGYWQLDKSSDNLDAVMAHGLNDYLDLTVFGTVNQSNAAVDPVPNPAGATWRWQAGDGTAADNAGSQAFGGGAGWYLSPADPQFYFDNDSSFTAECWFTTNSSNGYIFGNRHADSYLETSGWYTGWHLWVTSNGTFVTLLANGDPGRVQGDDSADVQLNAAITPGTWYHAAVVWDHDDGADGTLRLYLDGTEAASSSGSAAWSGFTGGSWAIAQRNIWVDENDLNLGVIWGQTGFSGSIDEVRFVDEALTPDQFLNGSTVYQPTEDIVRDGDIDIDGDVDIIDFSLFGQQWQMNTDPSQPDAVQL